MSNDLLDGLKRYVVAGSIQEELKREQDESINESNALKNKLIETQNIPSRKIDENPVYQSSARLVESVLREFQTAMDSASMQLPVSAQQECPKLKSSQALLRLIQDNIWKLSDANNPLSGEGLDDEIKEIFSSSLEPVIKVAIKKLHDIWCVEETKAPEQRPEADPVTVPLAPVGAIQLVVGEQITSPKGIVYTVAGINGSKVMLEDAAHRNSTVEKLIAIGWKK